VALAVFTGLAVQKRAILGAQEVSNNSGWGTYTTFDEVCRCASGRRHYNSWRTFLRHERRLKVFELLGRFGMFEHGVLARIAAELRVSRETVREAVRESEASADLLS
jgi:hypothetical protein